MNSITYTQKILILISIALVLILGIGILSFQYLYETGVENLSGEKVRIVQSQFDEEIEQQSKVLSGILYLLRENQTLRRILTEENKQGLLRETEQIFKRLQEELDISHFYFVNAQRKTILRVHNPGREGDIIDRYTMLQAEKTGLLTTGLELGIFGTYTLRAVMPWFEENKLLGYVELGIDSHKLLNDIAESTQSAFYLTFYKQVLNKVDWQTGQVLLGHNFDWDKFPNEVVSSKHGFQNNFYTNIFKNLPVDAIDNISITQAASDNLFVWRTSIVKDVKGRALGRLYHAINIKDWRDTMYKNGMVVLVIYLLIAFGLITATYRYTRRAQQINTQLKETRDKFQQLATYDQLTGLPNRQLFEKELAQRIQEAKRFNYKLAVCFIDLDNFKNVNDTLGHEQGDLLIKLAGERMACNIREYDVLARFGGDEFVLMMPHVKTELEISQTINKLIEKMAQPFPLDEEIVHVTLSAGISVFPIDGDNVDTLLRYADAAMYEAKDFGKNNYRFFTDKMNSGLLNRQKIEHRLRESLKHCDFRLFYQPILNVNNGAVERCEALLRWPNSLGDEVDIGPSEFIPIAERTHLIIELGKWVIDESCRQCRYWKDVARMDIKISINISGRQLLHTDIFGLINDSLEKYGLTHSDIGIELTENILIQANNQMLHNLKKMIDKGMEISVDDFGTGYSSLSYLKKLPISIVKIDKEFIRDAPVDPDDQVIIKTIVAMCHSLGMKVLAEGVETREQFNIIKQAGCDLVQGYHIQTPVPSEELIVGRDAYPAFDSASIS